MLIKTRGIVLHSLKFGDSSLIVTLYTENFGRISCIANATRGIKAKNKSAFMQPMFLLEVDIYQKKTRELQRIKEARLYKPFLSIPFDINKSSQVIFITELLYKILQEEEPNPFLYSFIENALVIFDSMKETSCIFHIWFMARLTEFTGIAPYFGAVKNGWFDMKKGIITERVPLHPFFMDREATAWFKKIMTSNILEISDITLSHDLRSELLIKLLNYYHLHFENLGNFNSLSVLKEVFQK
jgi:DNA repair protein RecO (recombination protein O)